MENKQYLFDALKIIKDEIDWINLTTHDEQLILALDKIGQYIKESKNSEAKDE